ncbi:YetF domain-containing protein [Brenneria populi subsp. brevivirga]|uniref:YetF domain-containing protein n=1 Tax=Brenneria populi TaxID=1505588 RepID=A0ABU6JPG6_9GAMM|nr:YetF domain-containing protein [Brenneria populi subsp. brevivirga]MEC5342387.1 YetF domain-containing protein [Brenneria populi Li et al. 2015]
MGYYGFILIKFIIGFFIVIMHLNLSGKTQLSQMTPVDFIGNFVLGGIIGGVIYSDSIPLHQYIIVLLIGVGLISLLNAITKHVSLFRSIAIGDPLPIVKKGRFLMDNILRKKNKIDILNVASQLHSQGINSFRQVSYAQIEPSGQLTVVCDDAKMPSVIIMKDGKIRYDELEQQIEKDEDWLNAQLAQRGLKAEEIFIAEFWDGKVMFILRDGKIVQ